MLTFVKLARPVHLLCAVFAYLLGAGIARYLGIAFDGPLFWLGLFISLALLVAAAWLNAYFDLAFAPLAPEETPRQRESLRSRLLQASFAALTAQGAAILALLLTKTLPLLAGASLLVALLLVVADAVPPLRLSNRGYGELLRAILLTIFLPVLAFLLQAGEFHRLVPLITFPLLLYVLASFLAADFSTFAADRKTGRVTLLIRLTWERAAPIHHFLLLASFLLFAAALFFGLSWGLLWPVFLDLPFALLQIFWLHRITSGAPPFWKFFDLLVPANLALVLYLLTLSFWLR